ncbi:MAG: NfeD family protein [Gammaproteobacteria bacterium]|nr:NfeD family protein [Gammaproteobacteria bacterium]
MIADYIVNHQAEFWIVVGFVLLVIEVVTGFTLGVFLFTGLGGIATGLLMMAGVLPETWIAGVTSMGISSGVIAALLWKLLKNLQRDGIPQKDNSSDLVGHEFILPTDISRVKSGTTQYSGISWRVEIDHNAGVDDIAAGQPVVVTSVEVGLFKVKPQL